MEQRATAALASVTASTAIEADGANGFLSGVSVVANINAGTAAFVGACQWQTSPDNTTWANVGVAFAGGLFNSQKITLNKFNRLNVTARTSGDVIGTLTTDV